MKTKLYLAAVAAGTCLLYIPAQLLTGRFTLLGLDYFALHRCRLAYAREFIFQSFGLPGWYTRELLGTPFWSNLHSFSWMPNHLVLLFIDPMFAFNVGVVLSALLAAAAMFFYCRALNLSHFSSAVSAWTYAASGFFAARVLVGHLPLLEAYGALPLLFWIIEEYSKAPRRSVELALVSAVCALCVSGHPQLPAYAIGTSVLYAFVRLDRRFFRRSALLMTQGVVLSAFVWVPMLLLLARSSRVLPMASAVNNIVFPYARLGAYFFPWKDGWPSIVMRADSHPFALGIDSGFWDTVCYIGWLPLIACAACLYLGAKRKLLKGPWIFLGCVGAVALVGALPLRDLFFGWFSQMLFRSPARQIYVLNFSLVVFLGVFLNHLEKSRWRFKKIGPLAIIVALTVWHVADLYAHSRPFVRAIPAAPNSTPRIDELLRSQLGSQRVAIDFRIFLAANRKYDDVGFFDSVALALPYKALVPQDRFGRFVDTEDLSGSRLSPETLANLGVKYVVTTSDETDLEKIFGEKSVNVFEISHPAPRVAFFDNTNSRPTDLSDLLRRPNPDQMTVSFRASKSGIVQLIEAWDIGWRAEVNGKAVPLLKSHGFLMAVPVEPGDNTIQLHFRTPGKYLGLLISLLGGLWACMFIRRRTS